MQALYMEAKGDCMSENKPVTLVVTDLDGTLLDSHKKVSERTRKAIAALKEHGILFGVASGRPVESGVILSKDWGLADSISFLIGMNGGALYDTRRKEKTVFSDMDGELILDVINTYKQNGMPHLHFEVMCGNKRYVEWSTPETLENAALFGEEEIIVNYDEFLKGRRVDKLIVRSLPEEQPAVIEISKKITSPNVTSFSTADVLYEYVNPEINKGYGLQKACDYYGLRLKDVVAFGDQSNDVEMLMLAGTGVAMANANSAAKTASNVVSDYTNDEDALAHYIEEVILPNAAGKVETEHGSVGQNILRTV
jgi:Cof subfamily protein (haloacid dehalogenase superfamily)